MKEPISISESNTIVEFNSGIYSVLIIGGWGVKLGNFSIKLFDQDSDTIIIAQNTIWRTQSYKFSRRAKKIATIEIPKRSNYRVEFSNADDLKVKKSNLHLRNFLQGELPKSEIGIFIRKKRSTTSAMTQRG
ncbi:MAG: hypothetical protein R2773_07500 [Flavobacteriaceae bacterium]